MVDLQLPSGAVFPVHDQEVGYFTERVEQYTKQNHFCLPAGTKVLTVDGPRSIETIEPGTMVWAYEEGQLVVRPTLHCLSVGSQPVFTVTTPMRTLRCSGTHPILAWTKQPSTVKRVGQRGRIPLAYQHEWVPAHDLRGKDGRRVAQKLVALHEVSDVGGDLAPTRTVTEEFAEFCGFFLGDGSYIAHGRNLRIAKKVDVEATIHYKTLLETVFGELARPLHEGEGYVERYDPSAVAEIRECGLWERSLTRRVPSWVFRLNTKLRLAFLRGYVDSDGSVDKKGCLCFGSPNGALIEDIRWLCMTVGVAVSNVCETHSRYQGNLVNVFTFQCSYPAEARAVGTHDSRYRERWAQDFSTKKQRLYPDAYGRLLVAPVGCIHTQVQKVIEGEPEELWDLEVEGAHSFVAEGLIVHNSNITHLQDLDRVMILELMVYRWGQWLSRQKDYWGDAVAEEELQKKIKEWSTELRQMKKALGLDKSTMDKQRGEDSVSTYLSNLLIRAREFGVLRQRQLGKALELFNQMKALLTLHQNCDAIERRDMHVETEDILEWLREVAIPEYDELDAFFRDHQQKTWIRSM